MSDVRHAPRLLEGAIIARSRQPPPPLPPPSPLCAFPRLPSSVFPFYVVTDWMTGDGCCCGWRSVVAPTADPPTLLLALCPVTRPLSLLFLVRPSSLHSPDREVRDRALYCDRASGGGAVWRANQSVMPKKGGDDISALKSMPTVKVDSMKYHAMNATLCIKASSAVGEITWGVRYGGDGVE